MLQWKSAYRDGSTHLVISALQFMQRLAARISRIWAYPRAATRCGAAAGAHPDGLIGKMYAPVRSVV